MGQGRPPELREFVPQARIFRINLRRFQYENLPGRAETHAVTEAMKRAFDGTFAESLEGVLRRLCSVPLDERIENLIVDICAYGVLVSDLTEIQVNMAISNTVQEPKGKKMAETARESIWQKGVEFGEARGEVKSKIKDILSVLSIRFKITPESVVYAVSAMNDLTALESILILAVTCDSIEDFAEALK